jgi:hypothetical protein
VRDDSAVLHGEHMVSPHSVLPILVGKAPVEGRIQQFANGLQLGVGRGIGGNDTNIDRHVRRSSSGHEVTI